MLHVLNSAILHRSGTHGRSHRSRQAPAGAWSPPKRQGALPLSGQQTPASSQQDHMVQQMLQACRASLVVCDDEEIWQATLTFECAEEPLLLVVDDHVETTDLLQRYLEGTRYRIAVCHNPAQALDTAQENQPILVLLDVMMPGVDGWEVLYAPETARGNRPHSGLGVHRARPVRAWPSLSAPTVSCASRLPVSRCWQRLTPNCRIGSQHGAERLDALQQIT